jgi:hypothetical protein
MHNMQAHKCHLLTTHQQTSYTMELDSTSYLIPNIKCFWNLQVPMYTERMADEIFTFSTKTARMLALLRLRCDSHTFLCTNVRGESTEN